ncbi:MAG: radical SAM protein [Candidatus Chisholmbacteria bacterium]|nr:radical SAM protein [Candidatus Chisholmbacteria bacterium]
MAAEQEQTIIEAHDAIPTPLARYPHTMEVRQLSGYSPRDGGIEPVWDGRLALYHPVKSELTRLGDEAWGVYDAFAQSPQNIAQVAEQTALDVDGVRTITDELKSRWILLTPGQEMNVTIQPNFGTEAELYLETTEACNFRCPGCATGADRYLASQARTMKSDTLETLLESTAQSVAEKGMERLRVKWAGGEALMPGSRRLLRVGQSVIDSLRDKHPDLDISQVILTNGSHLSDDVVSELKDWGAHVSVSLWGVGEENDRARGVRRDQDKYPNIIKGVERLHEAGVSYNVNHVVTPGNAGQFENFVRAMWDPESETFVGRYWNWGGGARPIPLGVTFFRPQTEAQLEALKRSGYTQMVEGLRGGFDVTRVLIERGVPIQPLDKIDYLQLFGVIPTPCGSGFNYLAAGPRGVASCHEALFSMSDNMGEIRDGANMVDLANREYVGRRHQLMGPNVIFQSNDPTTDLVLALHGGAGCPRTTRAEHDGQLGYAASTAQALYAPIILELLSLEAMRRIRVLGNQ